MKIVVDTNIVFSALLNSESKIGQLIIIGSKYFNYYSIGLLKEEIEEHKEKIIKISGLSKQQFLNSYEIITNRIKFIDEILISEDSVVKANDLVGDIDADDTLFVALTNQIKGKLWTGDKKLVSGLEKKNYSRIISTNDLYDQFIKQQK
jgi:predicted nucleic acid-binding protein